MFSLKSFLLTVAVAALLGEVAAQCPDGWEKAAATWKTNNDKFTPFPCYQFTITFDRMGSSTTSVVQVKDGVSVDGVSDTLEDYMALIGSACYDSCPDASASCSVQYNKSGYPYSFLIDFDKSRVGEEVRAKITDYMEHGIHCDAHANSRHIR